MDIVLTQPQASRSEKSNFGGVCRGTAASSSTEHRLDAAAHGSHNFGGVFRQQNLTTLVAFAALNFGGVCGGTSAFQPGIVFEQSHTGCSKISQLWWRLQLATSVAFAALNFGGVCGGTSAFQPGIVFEAVAYWLQ
jgi:hypothetical protein